MVSDELLKQVEKPARYIGNEINIVKKDKSSVDIRMVLCFPDVYEIGMSHLGISILYYFLNRREDTFCERCYAPWIDMENIMRKNNIPLFAIESFDSLLEFDIIGFTLQYEMSFTNIINILDLAGIPIFSKDRGENFPIICAGGPCAYNPEPLADIIDFFYIGEGEVKLDEVLDLYKENKGSCNHKQNFLEKLLLIDGIYVPKFYDVSYKENGEIAAFVKNNVSAPDIIKKVIVSDLDNVFYPKEQLVPLIETVHDRVSLEVFRGCIRGCRFCQAGFVYRPVREKSPDTLLEFADCLLKSSGHEEISLVSLSTSDYCSFFDVAEGLLKYKDEMINISLPSLRIDALSLELINKIQGVRKSSLTFAPEAGSQRMRDVINKNITEDEILDGVSLAYQSGFDKIKLYFMIGLPGETSDDIISIAKLSTAIVEKYYELPSDLRKRPPSINLSASAFVPKPFTPFQWDAQDSLESFVDKQMLLKKSIKKRQIRYTYHDAKLSRMEAVLSRGDRRVASAIVAAHSLGCRFDGWSEHFDYDKWVEAFDKVGLSMDFYAVRKRSFDEKLPWDHIDVGVSKEFLLNERYKADMACVSENCRQQCSHCGANKFGGGVCFEV